MCVGEARKSKEKTSHNQPLCDDQSILTLNSSTCNKQINYRKNNANNRTYLSLTVFQIENINETHAALPTTQSAIV